MIVCMRTTILKRRNTIRHLEGAGDHSNSLDKNSQSAKFRFLLASWCIWLSHFKKFEPLELCLSWRFGNTFLLLLAWQVIQSFPCSICEICGATAQNVASQQINEPSNAVATAVASSALTAPLTLVETRTIFHGRRIMNFLLACMLLAFAMSWLFHFKLMS